MITHLHLAEPSTRRPFQFLTDVELVDLLESDLQGSAVVRKAILEASVREVDPSLVTVVLDKYLHCALDELFQKYSKLSQLFFGDSPGEFFFPDARDYLDKLEATAAKVEAAEPQWPWDITVSDNSHSSRAGIPYFDNEHSALWVCGYRVGASGMPEGERRRFLVYFFSNQLPAAVVVRYGSDYGTPQSMARLRKMANVLAAHVRNFRGRRDACQYEQAISDWEGDLKFLKRSFYEAKAFSWPD